MRRLYILIILILMLTVGLWAQKESSPLYFRLLESEKYNLDMFYSTELQRLYVQLDFDIPKSSLDPAAHYGVFLIKDALFQNVMISGKFASHYFVNNLVPQHFVPELTKTELLKDDSPAKFYGFTIKDFADLPELVHVRMWYYLTVPVFKIDEMNKLSTYLDAEKFWYPRNFTSSSTVELKLTTTPFMTLLVNNSYAPQTDKQYSRIHNSTFLEIPHQPASVRLIRD